MQEELLLLGGLYVYPYDDFEVGDVRLDRLHQLLTSHFNTSEYPARQLLHHLAPDCETLVLRSMVFGQLVNVSTVLFKRLTSSSVCCIFNYPRKTYPLDLAHEKEYNNQTIPVTVQFESNSVLNSVQFVLSSDPDDFAYKEKLSDGFELCVFPQDDYATLQSSTDGEIFISYNTIVEVPVQPYFFNSSTAIKAFAPGIRKCYFPEEGERLIQRPFYSIDECLLLCRMRSQLRHCGCVSPTMTADILNVSYCGVLHLPCLTQWKRIWYGWNFFDYISDNDVAPSDEEEEEEDISDSRMFSAGQKQNSRLTVTADRCRHCLPTCDGIDFELDINELPLRFAYDKKYKNGLLKGMTNDKPLSIVKFYFWKRFAEETIEDIVSDWVVLLNRFGGILALMYGFSIISYIEIVYYFSGKWFMYICRAFKSQKDSKENVFSAISPPTSSQCIQTVSKISPCSPVPTELEPEDFKLYWKELNPKGINLSISRYSDVLLKRQDKY